MKTIPKPVIKENQKNSKLINVAEEYIQSIANKKHGDSMDDYENAVFEAALEMVFGDNVWEWVGENLQ